MGLLELRRNRGLSQRELADLAGVSPATVYELETGKRPQPRGRTLRKLAEALSVEVGELLEEAEARPKARSRPSSEWLAKAKKFIRRFDELDERADLDYPARAAASAVADGVRLLNRSRYYGNSSLAQRELTSEEFEDHFEAISRIAEIVGKAADTLTEEARAEEDAEGPRTA